MCTIVKYLYSTGDGDPPENAARFWRKIRSKDLTEDYLSHTRYALLGLGDTNYTTFLGFPKGVNKQLQKLGAKEFLSPGWADDAVGLEIVVDPWIEDLMSAIQKAKYLEESQPILSEPVEPSAHSSDILPYKDTERIQNGLPINDVPKLKVIQDEEFENLVNNLRKLNVCSEKLNSTALKIPVLSTPFLDITFNNEIKVT